MTCWSDWYEIETGHGYDYEDVVTHRAWVCPVCSAMVADRVRHQVWHGPRLRLLQASWPPGGEARTGSADT